jgi:hypothetical protein
MVGIFYCELYTVFEVYMRETMKRYFVLFILNFVSIVANAASVGKTVFFKVDSPRGLKIHAFPKTDSQVIIVVEHNQIVRLIERQSSSVVIDGVTGNWVKIGFHGNFGWAFSPFLKVVLNPKNPDIKINAVYALKNFNVWKKYEASYNDVLSWTDDFSIITNVSKFAKFSFRYPREWVFEGGCINNEQGMKIGDSPSLIEFPDSKRNIIIQKICAKKALQILRLRVNRYLVIKIVSKGHYEGGYPHWVGTWFPVDYYVFSSTKCFMISFFQTKLDYSEHRLFSKIIETVDFPD